MGIRTWNKQGGDEGEMSAIGTEIWPLNVTQGEVGVSFSSVTAQMQSVVKIYYDCITFLLSFNGNSMCNG